MQQAERQPSRIVAVGVTIGVVAIAVVVAILVTSRPDADRSPSAGEGADLQTLLTLHPEGVVVRAMDVRGEAEAAVAELADGLAEAGRAIGEPRHVVVDYPLADSVFPPDLVGPTFLWHDDSASTAWLAEITFQDGESSIRALLPGPPAPQGEIDPDTLGPTNEVYQPDEYAASAHSWTPSPALWEEIKRRSVEAPATVTFLGFAADRPSEPVSKGGVTLTTSMDPVGAPIFYRDVPLMPVPADGTGVIKPLKGSAIPLIAWRLRDLSRPESKVVLKGMPSCANCHSFSLDGKTLAMDVDGPHGDKGSYAVAPISQNMSIGTEQVITWNSFPDKPKGHKTIGFLSRVSPDGKWVLSTVNEDLYVANFTNYKFLQVFYPTRGIIASYSAETGEMKALPGADDPTYVHCNPVWTPDGKTIIFSRARAFDAEQEGKPLATHPNDPNEPRIQYDLYRLPFNEGRGGTPVPIEGASNNGMSNTFPKVSPDGKWIVFTKCKNGQLMRPDGRLWILPIEGGEAREMRCNTSLMNSWHSFSPNGRWMVFSSKVNTPYTQMFLTHLDEDGNDTPYVLIPNSTAANRAVNLPEFLNARYEDLDSIQVPAVNHHRYYLTGTDLIEAGRYAEAIPELEKAIEADPDFVRAHVQIGFALGQIGEVERAKEHYEKVLEFDPKDPAAHNGLGCALGEKGQAAEAIAEFRRALDYDPYFFPALLNLTMAYESLGRYEDALIQLRQALNVRPREPDVHRHLSRIYLQLGQVAEAVQHLDHLAALDPSDFKSSSLLAWFLATHPDPDIRDGKSAVALALRASRQSGYAHPETLDALAAAYAETGQFDLAEETATRAIGLARGRNPVLRERLEARRQLYRANRPYRTPSPDER